MTITRDDVIGMLRTVYDPEIPVNIWDLGLVYDIEIADTIVIKMTLTSPTCPMMDELVAMVRDAVSSISGGVPVRVELVWDPPWDLSRMSDAAKLELDLTNSGW